MINDNESSKTIQHECDWSKIEPSYAIIEAVAAIEGVEPMMLSDELDTTLYDQVNIESLNGLVTADQDISISFIFERYRIHIDRNTVSVSELATSAGVN